MKPKYEVIEIDNAQVTVDISLLSKTEELFFLLKGGTRW